MRLALISLVMIPLVVGCEMDAGTDEWRVDDLSIARDGLNYAEVSGTVTLNSTSASLGSKAEVRYYQDQYETLIVTTEEYIGSDLEDEGETQAFEISHYEVYVTPAVGGYETVCAEFRAGDSNHRDWTRAGCLGDADTDGPMVAHEELTAQPAGVDVLITAIVTDESGILTVVVRYQQSTSNDWLETSMTLADSASGTFRGVIPGSHVGSSMMRYYFYAVDNSENETYEPEGANERLSQAFTFGVSP